MEFSEKDHMFLKVSSSKGIMCFGKKGKLSPQFIGIFEILDRVGELAYRLALSPELSRVHNVFHVSMLHKYHSNPSHVIKYEPLELSDDLCYVKKPIRILDKKDKVLRSKVIPLVKVLWQHHSEEEATWELESLMRTKFHKVGRM